MPEGTGTFAVWAHNRFLAYDRPKYDCKWGRQIYTSHRGSFLRNWNLLLLYMPVNRLAAAEGMYIPPFWQANHPKPFKVTLILVLITISLLTSLSFAENNFTIWLTLL